MPSKPRTTPRTGRGTSRVTATAVEPTTDEQAETPKFRPGGVRDLLVAKYGPSPNYSELSRRSVIHDIDDEGNVTERKVAWQRWQQIIKDDVQGWQSDWTYRCIAKTLGVSVTRVVLANALSLGYEPPADTLMRTYEPAEVEYLELPDVLLVAELQRHLGTLRREAAAVEEEPEPEEDAPAPRRKRTR